MKLPDLAQREPQHAMVFGRSKSGKSTLVSKLAEAGFNLIWLSLDNGHRVLYKLNPTAQKKVDIIVLPDVRDFPVAMDTVRKLLKSSNDTKVCHQHGIVNCTPCTKAGADFTVYNFKKLDLGTVVVIDHLTQLTDSCMALICKGQPVDYKPKLDDWGSLRFNMLDMLTEIQQAPYNICCIAQEMESEMEDGKKIIVPQVGSREFGKSVGSFFDHIVYCDVTNKSHRSGSATTYSMSVLTGSRSDVAVEKDPVAGLSPIFFNSGRVPISREQLDRAEEKKITEEKATVALLSASESLMAIKAASASSAPAASTAATATLINTALPEEMSISERARLRLLQLKGGNK